MTLLHPSRAGSAISVWFVHEVPVRLLSGGSRFRVVGEPKCADINGIRYWRVRARSDSGQHATFDLRESAEGWVLDGVEDAGTGSATSNGAS
jgi:hypothetical protein